MTKYKYKNKKVGDFWDSLSNEIKNQILLEMNYDSYVETWGKDPKHFEFGMAESIKKVLVKDFKDYENSVSNTFRDIRYQMDNPKDMDLTADWWDLNTVDTNEALIEPYEDSEAFANVDGTEQWMDLCDEDKWTIHENRLANMTPPIILTHLNNKILSLKQSSACVSREKEQTERAKAMKKVKVTCWHCDNTDQKILSETESFKCDKCNEHLWTGDGGFLEIKVGVWR